MADLHSLCRDRARELLDGARKASDQTGIWIADYDPTIGSWAVQLDDGTQVVCPADLMVAPQHARHIAAWSPSLVISVCESWLKTIDKHQPKAHPLGALCNSCRCPVQYCQWIKSIAYQLQITEED